MYYVLKLKGNLSLTDRKKYIDSLLGTKMWDTQDKIGMMEKFAKSVQFSDKTEEKVKSTLYEAIHVNPYGETFIEFYFNQDSIEIAKKFTKFVKKVYPQISISTDGSFSRPSVLEFVMSYLFSSLTGYPTTVECSLAEPLTEDELNKVKTLIEDIKQDNLFYICRQFKCDTCNEYDPDKHYHFEVENHYTFSILKKTRKELGMNVDECFFCKKIVTGDFCEFCESPYVFKV